MAFLNIDIKRYAEEVAKMALDEILYKGRTLREWFDSIANPQTNADRIRNMTDEELAEYLNFFGDCPCQGKAYCDKADSCEGAILLHLKAEANDNWRIPS